MGLVRSLLPSYSYINAMFFYLEAKRYKLLIKNSKLSYKKMQRKCLFSQVMNLFRISKTLPVCSLAEGKAGSDAFGRSFISGLNDGQSGVSRLQNSPSCPL